MAITKNNTQAAIPVRNATTANGEKPCVMASFPKTGAKPRKNAALKAARIPPDFLLGKDTSL